MITIEQVQKLRELHDAEKQAYFDTHESPSMVVYYVWVAACDELNSFIDSIIKD